MTTAEAVKILRAFGKIERQGDRYRAQVWGGTLAVQEWPANGIWIRGEFRSSHTGGHTFTRRVLSEADLRNLIAEYGGVI